jgi:hypothetical protein
MVEVVDNLPSGFGFAWDKSDVQTIAILREDEMHCSGGSRSWRPALLCRKEEYLKAPIEAD